MIAIIKKTYNTDGQLTQGNEGLVKNIDTYSELFDLLFKCSVLDGYESCDNEIVITFPNKDPETIKIEIVNGYRE